MERNDKEMLDLLRTRRSIRKYKNKAIEKEKVDTILKAALLAPSSRKRRPWEFVVVPDKEMLQTLSQCRESSAKFLGAAPLAIVVAADPEVCDVWIEDCSIAAIIMQLTAHSLGLGSCWIQVRERFTSKQEKTEDYIKKALGIPETYHVECIVAVGYPGEEKKSYDDKDLLEEKIHSERF